MGGAPTVSVPGPSAEERALQAEQAELLRFQSQIIQQQFEQQQALLPFFAEQAGFELIRSEGDPQAQRQLNQVNRQIQNLQRQLSGRSERERLIAQRTGRDPLRDEIRELQEQRALLSQRAQGGAITGAREIEDPARELREQLELEFLNEQLAEIERRREQEGETEGLRQQELEIRQALNERSLQALRGELPVDPALEQQLERGEETLRERLAAQFGPGFETSTPGIQALEEFRRSAETLRSGARTGQLTLAEQLSLGREQAAQARQQGNLAQLQAPLSLAELGLTGGAQQLGQFQSGAFGLPQSIAGGAGQVAAGFGAAQQPFIQQRQMQLQASIANAQNAGAGAAGLGQLAGSVFGTVFPALGFSDRRLKRIVERIGTLPGGISLYVYEFLFTGTRKIGVVAQEAMQVRPDVVGTRDGFLTVDYRGLQYG